MSFPPQSPGGGHGPPPPPTGGDSYGYQHQAPHQAPQAPWTPPSDGGKDPRGPRTAAIAVGVVALVAAAVGGLALGLRGGDDGKGNQAAANGRTTPSGDAATGAGAGAGTQSTEGAPGAQSPSAGGKAAADLVRYVVLRPGRCFDHPGLSSGVSQVTTRSCDKPHDGEVIANEKLTGDFANSAALRSRVLKLCQADARKRMESIPVDGRTYYYYAIYPSLNTFAVQKKDTISCSLTLSNRQGGKKLAKPLR